LRRADHPFKVKVIIFGINFEWEQARKANPSKEEEEEQELINFHAAGTSKYQEGTAIAQAVSHWLPTAATRVHTRV
jgi:hypothetical protein